MSGGNQKTGASEPREEGEKKKKGKQSGLSFRRNIQMNIDIEKSPDALDNSNTSEVMNDLYLEQSNHNQLSVPFHVSNHSILARTLPPPSCLTLKRMTIHHPARNPLFPLTPPPSLSPLDCLLYLQIFLRSQSRHSSVSFGCGQDSSPPPPAWP